MANLFEFERIGTHWVIESDQTFTDGIKKIVLDRIELFDSSYSRFRDDSLVTIMSRSKGVYALPYDAQPLFDLYKKLYELTEGRVTPLIGETLVQAGYDAQYSLEKKTMSVPPRWEDAMSISYNNIEMLQPVLIDVGAAGKGYLVDIIADLLEAHAMTSFTINAGGDIVHRGTLDESIEVALENPFNVSEAIGVAKISAESICGSSGNRRAWGEFTHIINPETLNSATNIAATWVVAKTGLLADGLATALYFTNPESLISNFSFEYLILYTDGSVARSKQFPAELFYR